MFETLSGKLNQIFNNLRKRGKLSTDDVDAVLREIRLALLEADVHYSVVKGFLSRVKTRAVGVEVSKALNPAQLVIKIVHEELIAELGQPERLNLTGEKPRVIMLVGLQGSGKTTAAAKLAAVLRSQGERVELVAADPYRPAAIAQLQILGGKVGVPVFTQSGLTPPDLVKKAHNNAQKSGATVMIIDTAGRSQLDESLMSELRAIRSKVEPVETLLVVDSMIGQEALHVAEGFRDSVKLTGLVMTKMDGDSRGGAAISIRSVTGVPIKYLSTGENIEAIESYLPDRLASRILGMGDILGLIEKAEAAFDVGTAQKQAATLASGQFTLEDFADQLKQMKKMGPLSQIFDLLPGDLGKAAKSVSPQETEYRLKLTEAIINSMTRVERRNPDILNASRRKRIATGAGTVVMEVNQVLRQFRDMQRLMKTLKKTGNKGMASLFRNLK
ncbi:MAG: signal recognition particle protein [Anaerolinea sp.]|nr:signal recognition particle protein [Anaerolinea sp.]